MIVAPVPRRIEVACPDAQAIPPGGSLLDPVPAGCNGKSLGDHGSTKIATGNQAGGQKPVILVDVFGAAIGRTGGEQLRHAVARGPAAGPGAAIGVDTVLRQLGRIEPQQSDAILAQPEAVAIAGATEARNGRWRLIECSRNHRRQSQQANGEKRPDGAAKETVALIESGPDFTTR